MDLLNDSKRTTKLVTRLKDTKVKAFCSYKAPSQTMCVQTWLIYIHSVKKKNDKDGKMSMLFVEVISTKNLKPSEYEEM